MKIAIVGGTGNIGAKVSHAALTAGHDVRFMTRGSSAADDLVARGAEPFIGSFELDTPATEAFFENADVAFTMIRSDWSKPDHYPVVAKRMAVALRRYTPDLVVNLSSVGADLDDAGHSTGFKLAEAELNDIENSRIVHLRAGWFAENFLSHIEGIKKWGTLATGIRPDVPLPIVTTNDVARAVIEEIFDQSISTSGLREVQGPEDLTIDTVAVHIARVIHRSVQVVHTPLHEPAIKDEFIKRFGKLELLNHRLASNAAFNERRAQFIQTRSKFDLTSTHFKDFLRETWKPAYLADIQSNETPLNSWQSWLDGYAASVSNN